MSWSDLSSPVRTVRLTSEPSLVGLSQRARVERKPLSIIVSWYCRFRMNSCTSGIIRVLAIAGLGGVSANASSSWSAAFSILSSISVVTSLHSWRL